MSNENKSTREATKSLEGEFRFSCVGGPRLGTSVFERQSLLVLDQTNGSMRLEKHRSESDAEEEPIGIFQAQLDPSLFQKIMRLADSVELADLSQGTRGGPGSSSLKFEYISDTTRYEKSISSFDHEQITTIEPLLDELYKAQGQLLQSAISAIVISIRHVGTVNDGHLELVIRNVGSAPLYIGDPRWLDIDVDNWAGARVAVLPTEVPGVTSNPLEWERVFIARPQTDRPANDDVLIHPQSEVSYPTERWVPKAHGNRYIIQGVFSSYQGPAEINGVYRIRGGAFSKAIEKPY